MHALQQAPAESTAGPSAPQSDAGHQAYLMLRLAFTVAPIAFGIDMM